MDLRGFNGPTEPAPDDRKPDNSAGHLEADEQDQQERGDDDEQTRDQELLELRLGAGLSARSAGARGWRLIDRAASCRRGPW